MLFIVGLVRSAKKEENMRGTLFGLVFLAIGMGTASADGWVIIERKQPTEFLMTGYRLVAVHQPTGTLYLQKGVKLVKCYRITERAFVCSLLTRITAR